MLQPRVNLFVVGAPKSGTTTLYAYCASHPEILVSNVKEPHYFGDYRSPKSEYYASKKEYEALYTQHTDTGIKYLADFSPSYLYSNNAAVQIKAYNPDAKVIALLRNPVERTISMYFHQRKSLLEPLDFEAAMNAELDRIKMGWNYGFHYRSASLYHDQILRYLNIFGSQFKVFFFEDFILNPEAVNKKIQSFLGLEAPFSKNNIHLNKTGEIKSILIQNLIKKRYPFKNVIRKLLGEIIINYITTANIGKKTEIDFSSKEKLSKFFVSDIRKLELLLNTNSGWIEKKQENQENKSY